MTKITPRAKKLARSLRRENRVLSWRKIAERYNNPIIKPGTLHRIATSLKHEGDQWYPKDKEILLALGLIKPRKPRITRPLTERTTDELVNLRDRLARRLEQIDDLITQRTS